MAAAAILNFEKLMPFLKPLTDILKNLWECDDVNMEHNNNIKIHVFTKSKMAAAAILNFKEPLLFHNHLTNPHQN
jgi:hypothetical protein